MRDYTSAKAHRTTVFYATIGQLMSPLLANMSEIYYICRVNLLFITQ